ncbi:gle1 RNA export mediator isoform X1 [Andrena cerasifolii]|uniref:gle1 RNA export mediator isoform X1 n=2 Tax=Andrena cerasifolii TaxID=2819439 RepID=UPI004037DD77
MPQFVNSKVDIIQNMNDISSDFTCLKVSALKKASRIAGEVDRITIGPDSTVNENECQKLENIENEQNSCNITVLQKPILSHSNNSSTQSGITFSVKKILLESENQRKEEVRKVIERHWQHMKENGKAIKEHMAISQSHMAMERERKSKENYAYILAEERIAEQEEIRRRHERQKEVEEYKKKMKEKEEITKKIMNLRNAFGMKYHDIITLSENCKDKHSVGIILTSYAAKLGELHHQIELIAENIKTGEVTPTDLSITEKIVYQIDEILCIFKSEIEKINAQYETNLANIESAKQCQINPQTLKKQKSNTLTICEVISPEQTNINDIQINKDKCRDEEQQKNEETAASVTTPHSPLLTPTGVDTEVASPTAKQNESHLYEYVDRESLQIYMNSVQFLRNYMQNYEEFQQSPSTKTLRFECQKAINIPVNAISGINEQHLRDKYERLHNLLIGRSSPNFNSHPQGAAFCKNVLALKIVNQGETLVSSKPKMAFPIAAIIVALWNDHPDFGDLLLSHFHTTCPYTVPVFLAKMVDQSNEDYYKSLGYKYTEEGAIEMHDKFLKRMSGLMRLYASITITSQRKGIVKGNPYGLQNAWRWLAAILNIEPRAEIADLCATFLLDMLEVAGRALWAAYPNQFLKLLILLTEEYYPRMQSVGCISGGPLVRLEEFLRNSLAKGSIPPPEGQLSPNFW